MRLHPERTVLVTPVDDDSAGFLRRPSLDCEGSWSSSTAPPQGEWDVRRRYLFAKIGSGDATACPELLPGTMVRVDRYYAQRIRGIHRDAIGSSLWLVEQPHGLTCCRVQWIDDRQILLLPSRMPWGRWPLRLPTEARILGLVETHCCRLQPAGLQPGATPARFAAPTPALPARKDEVFRPAPNLAGTRGLTFRAAHRLTRAVAQNLGNREYTIALGTLSDYEAMGELPRHIAKTLSLSLCGLLHGFSRTHGGRAEGHRRFREIASPCAG